MSPRRIGGMEPSDLLQPLPEENTEEIRSAGGELFAQAEEFPAQEDPDDVRTEAAAVYPQPEEDAGAVQDMPPSGQEDFPDGAEGPDMSEFAETVPDEELPEAAQGSSSPGYEEFAEVPTGGYLDRVSEYGKELELPYGGDTYAGGTRTRKSRVEQRTGTVSKVPLREVKKEEVRDIGSQAGKKRTRTSRHGNRMVVWAFVLFVGIIALLLIFLPKSYFSAEERSVLAAEPTLSPRTLFDGSFEEDAETYVSDHFPLRSGWIGLNSYYNLLSGRRLINGVYVGKNNYIIEEPTEPDQKALEENMAAVRAFVSERGYPASFLAVPAAGYILEEELPAVHLPYHDLEILTNARVLLGDDVGWIDIVPDLTAEAAVEQVYYRTDHHWTTLGAYIGYLRWAQAENTAPLPVDRFRISYYDGFRGSTYAKVLLWNTPADMIALWEQDGTYTVEMSDGSEPPEVTDTFYDMEALTSYDPYMVFFGGNHGLMHITNASSEAQGTLLLIKDSFANCFIPFVAPHYKELYVVDPRYYRDLRSLCDTTAIDEVLFIYSTHNLVTDQDLGLIDM